MKLYFAPMEGITPYVFRNIHNEMFGGCDAYYAPFIVPSENERITLKTLRDILRKNNSAKVIPQILCNKPEAFVNFSEKLPYMCYDEINLNLGCPSGTVVKKGRGAGALKDTDSLDAFLNEIFEKSKIDISIKTRSGFYEHEEFEELLRIFSKYPVKELIIHPRVREEFYKGKANLAVFEKAYAGTKLKLCYNGDIWSLEDYKNIANRFEKIDSVMIGRGAIKNPAIFREIKGGKPLETVELVDFSKKLEEKYLEVLKSEVYTIHRLKEIWIFMMMNYPEERKILKAIKKSLKLADLNNAIESLPQLEK